jgi:nucleoside-diphosphate-sugar epimerase
MAMVEFGVKTMRIAIFGATSEIAKDLILSFAAKCNHELVLYARRPDAVKNWLSTLGLHERYNVATFNAFRATEHFDAVLNFVGVGNPAQAAAMGASIFEVTLQYDELALNYVRQHSNCRYIFLSSGAVYGSNFEEPVDENAKATVAINGLQPQDWYGAAKIHAECRHRSLLHLPIVDIRVFNYFSRTQDMSARFLIADVVRAIQFGEVFVTSAENIVRDYLGSQDFYQIIHKILQSDPINTSVDCYTITPVDKFQMFETLKSKFGLLYTLADFDSRVNGTGNKKNYYSCNCRANSFFGYKPTLSSLENVVREAEFLLNH